MKAIAKNDIKYSWYDYTNYIAGNKYEAKEFPEIFQIHIRDEKEHMIQYCGGKESLYELFEFVEE